MKVSFQPRKSLAEIYSKGMEYSILNEKGEGITVPVRCKDFFQDVIWSEVTKKDASIYGFTHKPTGNILNQETLYIGVRNSDIKDKQIGKYSENLQRLLNDIENKNGVPTSIVTSCNDEEYIHIAFNNWWISKPYLFSALTLLIRCGINYIDENVESFLKRVSIKSNTLIGSNDTMYIKGGLQNLLDLSNGIIHDQSWEQYSSVGDVHNRSGVVSFKPVLDSQKAL